MTEAEHERIRRLLANNESLVRTVEDIPGGVKTTTTTSSPELAEVLRTHVEDMTARLKADRPVRSWDPVFRDVFDHADEIELRTERLPNGIVVAETTVNPKVVPIIRAHARQVSAFVAEGPDAAAPPWAGWRER